VARALRFDPEKPFSSPANRGDHTGMKNLDFSSWQNLLSTLFALALVTLIGVGLRLLVMSTIQQRRERANRQINERLRVLMAAYKTLGGSFTGDLAVDPTHLRDLRRRHHSSSGDAGLSGLNPGPPFITGDGDISGLGSDRARRVRDAVEAALSDIILLGTADHVRLAERAARELVAGRTVHTHDLVVSLRDFIRQSLDLDPIPADLQIPMQGPTRPGSASGGRAKGGGAEEGGSGGGRRGGGDGGTGGMAAGMGMGGMGAVGLGIGGHGDDDGSLSDDHDHGSRNHP